MLGAAERMDGIPPAPRGRTEAEDIFLYGVDLQSSPSENAPDDQVREQKVLAYAFCYQGHCYRLAIPAEFHFRGYNRRNPEGCGFELGTRFFMWQLQRTTAVTRVERRGGSAEDLILDFNLPGQSPASLTYSAKVAIAGKAGKVYE